MADESLQCKLLKLYQRNKAVKNGYFYQFCLTIKMILKQSPSQIQRTYQVSTGQQFIQRVLQINHLSQMLNNRYARIFYQYFGRLMHPSSDDQFQARDRLIFANQQQQMKKLYRMKEIVSTIREAVLTRIRQDRIAPILARSPAQFRIMHIVYRRNRAGFTQLPESNTMHTQSSSKKQKSRMIYVQRKILPSKWESIKDIPSRHSDISSQILSKVTHDLSKMIQSICIYEQKPTHQYSNLKFIKSITIKTNTHTKHFKRKLLLQDISMIKANNQEDNFNVRMMNFDQPQENYGLRKMKRKKTKSNDLKSKHRKYHLSSQFNKTKSKRKISETAKKQTIQRLHLSPLTPNPFSTSKSRQGWADNCNKNSRFSLKSNLSRALQKSNSGKIEKLQKSPLIIKKSTPKNRLVQQKSPRLSKKVQR